jgi:integrase
MHNKSKLRTPVLCAFTDARVVEITQLRSQDIRDEEGTFVLRISPGAGTVKTGQYRDVPIHPQIIELGFRGFVEKSVGRLFYVASNKKDPVRAARTSAQIVSRWLHKNNLIVQSVAPNHGWRHRFKTVGREVGIHDRVLDALMGHASTTAGDAYGDVTIKTKAKAINRLPRDALE